MLKEVPADIQCIIRALLIQRMDGFVTYIPDILDRRLVHVKLTPKGIVTENLLQRSS